MSSFQEVYNLLKNGGYIRCQGLTRDKIELFDKQHTRINIIDNDTFETLLKYKYIENKSIYKGSYNEYFTINEKTD